MDWHVGKLYKLNVNGNWDDDGTGTIRFETREDGGYLVMKSVMTENVMLDYRVSKDHEYTLFGDKGQEGIISWSDSQDSLALSFKEGVGCLPIFGEIRAAQENEIEELIKVEIIPQLPDPPHITDLETILMSLKDCCTISARRRKMGMQLMEKKYIGKLLEVFQLTEDLDDKESLTVMFEVIKHLFLLNDRELYGVLLSRSFVLDVMGALEYDPELSRKQNHRQFLSETVVFREIVPFSNRSVVEAIHMNAWINYLKDVVLPRALDDRGFQILHIFLSCNNSFIISSIMSDEEHLPTLFRRLKSGSDEDELSLFKYVQELFHVSKEKDEDNQRTELYTSLLHHGLLDILRVRGICSRDVGIRHAATDILSVFVERELSLIRSEMIGSSESENSFPFLRSIIEQIKSDENVGLQCQFTDLVRMLLCCSKEFGNTPEKDDFLDVFYDNIMEDFVQIITAPEMSRECREQVIEVLLFCVENHEYRSKYFLLQKDVIPLVMSFCTDVDSQNSKILLLASLKFLGSVIGMEDPFYNKHIIHKRLFVNVMDVFRKNIHKYNMINSAVLGILKVILESNSKLLLDHIVTEFRDILSSVDYVSACAELIDKFDNWTEEEWKENDGMSVSQNRRQRELDREEAYFDADDDEDGVDQIDVVGSSDDVPYS